MSEIKISKLSLAELATYVSEHLKSHGIDVVLVGGGCVSIYSNNQYQTQDLDFVERYHSKRSTLKAVLDLIGFTEKNRYYIHPDAAYLLEFPTGPLAIGDEAVKEVHEMQTENGTLRLLTATDCIKDRLSAFYHWQDRQSLQQALWVAQNHPHDIEAIEIWSSHEAKAEKYLEFKTLLNEQQRDTY